MSTEQKSFAIKEAEQVVNSSATHGLKQCDFQSLVAELCKQHFEGTREWLFDEVRAWLRTDTRRLFWLVGAAGTGKSVVSAKLLEIADIKKYVVAWHFCRHDNAAESSVQVIVESWAAMLSKNVSGFVITREAKMKAAGANHVEMFELLVAAPLREAQKRMAKTNSGGEGERLVFVLDALDELPRESLGPVLNLIAMVFVQMPLNVKLFVTSRGESEIKVQLQNFEPAELYVDEIRNKADVRAYLAHVAREYFKQEMTLGDLEARLEGQFELSSGVLKDKLSGIEHSIQLSKAVYDDVIRPLREHPAFRSVCAIENKNAHVEPLQAESNLDRLYEDAKEAREKLLQVFASEWEEYSRVDGGKTVLRRPVKGKAAEWVDEVVDPGLKSRESAQRKFTNDYGGDARRMKDLVRITTECHNCERMLEVLAQMQTNKNLDIAMLRNKYATPTLLGYSDFNLSVRVNLGSGRSHICEVQVNLRQMLTAKALAHVHYEQVRSAIPAICDAADILDNKKREQFEGSVLKMLRRSALDAAVEQLEAKTGGLFLYATLLIRELKLQPGLRNFSQLRQLPAGLSEVYEVNFDRMVGKDRAEWPKYRRVVSMVVAAREPVPTSIVQEVLGSDLEHTVTSLSVLFPTRDDRLEVMHKSVADWLARPGHAYSLSSHDVRTAHNELASLSINLSLEYSHVHLHDIDYSTVSRGCSFALRQVTYHLCAAGRVQEAHQVVTSFAWLLARVATGSPAVLVTDIEYVKQVQFQSTTKLVASALRLALGALHEDWRHLAGQLVGRLLGHIEKDEVYGLLQQVCSWRGPAEGWWCPIQPTLELAGGRQVLSFSHSTSVQDARWSPDQKMVCSCSSDHRVWVWSVERGECMRTLTGHTMTVISVAWSIDGKQICSGSWDKTIRVWSVESGTCTRILTGHTFYVDSVAWSADDKQICSGSNDKTVRVWSAESGECVRILTGHTGAVNSVTWSIDGKQICSSGWDNTIRVWSVQNGECVRTLTEHTAVVSEVAWSSDGKYICSSSWDKTIRVWLVESGECVRTLAGHTGGVCSVAWSSDGKHICSGSHDSTVRVWSVEDGECVQNLTGHTMSVASVEWSADGKQICSASNDKTVIIWSAESGETAQMLMGHDVCVTSVAWSHDGKQLCSGGYDETIRVWSAKSGECLRILTGHTGSVGSVAWSSDGKHICSGSRDKTIRLWSTENGECVRTLTAHTAAVAEVAWSIDGKHICSGSWDQTIRVWLVKSGECVQILTGHTDRVASVAWSSDGKNICSGSNDETVRVWSVKSGECVRILTEHTDPVALVAWSTDNKQIYSISASTKTVRVWSVKSGAVVDNYVKPPLLQTQWDLMCVKNDGGPIGFEADMTYLISAQDKTQQCFAQTKTNRACIHTLHARGGSQGNDKNLDFLHLRAKKESKRSESNFITENKEGSFDSQANLLVGSKALQCVKCQQKFSLLIWRYNCQQCKKVFCASCCPKKHKVDQRVCVDCGLKTAPSRT